MVSYAYVFVCNPCVRVRGCGSGMCDRSSVENQPWLEVNGRSAHTRVCVSLTMENNLRQSYHGEELFKAFWHFSTKHRSTKTVKK
jgi:hypothetical protein